MSQRVELSGLGVQRAQGEKKGRQTGRVGVLGDEAAADAADVGMGHEEESERMDGCW